MSPDVGKKRLSLIDDNLRYLRSLVEETGGEFNLQQRYAAERMIMLLVEFAIDLLKHKLKDMRQIKTTSYREALTEAADQDLITSELKQELYELTRFRNNLVHQYDDIEYEEVTVNARECLTVFEKFIRQMKRIVE